MEGQIKIDYHKKDKMVVDIIHGLVLFLVCTFKIIVIIPSFHQQNLGLVFLCYTGIEYFLIQRMQIDDCTPFTLNIWFSIQKNDCKSLLIQLFSYFVCYQFVGWIEYKQYIVLILIFQFICLIKPRWWPLQIVPSLIFQNTIKFYS